MVRRLITMVDAFYDRHVRLVISAEVPPPLLFAPDKDTDKADAAAAAGLNQHGDILGSSAYVPDSRDEVFAFDRTLSRLQEMRSHAYLVRAAEGGHGHKLAANHVPIVLFDATEALSEEEVSRLFHEYDVDASGALERPEVRLLLQDLTERRRGHRNVMEEEVEHAFSIMDADQSGEVTKAEFLEYFTGVTLSGATILQYGGKGAEQEEQGVAAARPATPGA
jgi:Ca2+-binding EF-hand superfamily protein